MAFGARRECWSRVKGGAGKGPATAVLRPRRCPQAAKASTGASLDAVKPRSLVLPLSKGRPQLPGGGRH
jgi:hypothetical protein